MLVHVITVRMMQVTVMEVVLVAVVRDRRMAASGSVDVRVSFVLFANSHIRPFWMDTDDTMRASRTEFQAGQVGLISPRSFLAELHRQHVDPLLGGVARILRRAQEER